jgi:tetratricopeptide (TPR) repeat protein
MRAHRLAKWSVAVAVAAASTVARAQEPSSQKLFESGNWGAVAERAGSGSPEDRYLAAMAHIKTENFEAAAAEMSRLREEGPDEAWKQVGASGAAMLQRNQAEAIEAGRRATEMAGDNPYAHYQLGYAAGLANDFGLAAQEMERATELKFDFAYAHYWAGQMFQKQRNVAKAADHYQHFLTLAPDSPDRAAVQGILRTLRK